MAIQRAFKRSPAELIGPASTFFSLNGKWFEWKEFRSVLRRSVGRGKKEKKKKNRKKKKGKKEKAPVYSVDGRRNLEAVGEESSGCSSAGEPSPPRSVDSLDRR